MYNCFCLRNISDIIKIFYLNKIKNVIVESVKVSFTNLHLLSGYLKLDFALNLLSRMTVETEELSKGTYRT